MRQAQDDVHIPSWAVPGQRVVCLGPEDSWRVRDTLEPSAGPHVGQVLTIRDVAWDDFGDVFLVFPDFPGDAWLCRYFRPVDRREVERELFLARQCGADVALEGEPA